MDSETSPALFFNAAIFAALTVASSSGQPIELAHLTVDTAWPEAEKAAATWMREMLPSGGLN